MVRAVCMLNNTVVAKESRCILQTFPQWDGANGNILQVDSSEVFSYKCTNWNAEYMCTQRQDHKNGS